MDCARVARAHNFIELQEVIIMVREVVVFSQELCIYRNGIYIFFTFDSEKRKRKIGVKDVGK